MKSHWKATSGVAVLAAVLIALCIGIAACKPASGPAPTPTPTPGPTEQTPIPLMTGFETEGAEAVIEGTLGITVSMNSDARYVLNGSRSLKLHTADFAECRFAFSERVTPRSIEQYRYISFWLYNASDVPVFLGNTANYNVRDDGGNIVSHNYLQEAMQPHTWTKIKLQQNSAVFNTVRYNISFNEFVLGAAGAYAGRVMPIDLYVDDIRLYTDGMTGECELYLTDGDGNPIDALPAGTTTAAYPLPAPTVVGPDGYQILGAKAAVAVTDAQGAAVTLRDGALLTTRAGRYTVTYTYEQDGIKSILRTALDIRFADFGQLSLGQAAVGSAYTLPQLPVYACDTTTPLEGAQCSVAVTDAQGKAVAVSGDTVTLSTAGLYHIRYTVTHGENIAEIDKPLWATAFRGLTADFSHGEDVMFESASSDGAARLLVSENNFKTSADGNKKALRMTVENSAAPTLRLTEYFPYRSLDGCKYLSFWLYNGTEYPLLVECSASAALKPLNPSSWNRVRYAADELYAGVPLTGAEFVLYENNERGKAKLNGDFYVDDVRVIRDGDPEEIDFSSAVTTDDYDAAAGTGTRFAQNGTYELDLRLFDLTGEAIEGQQAQVVEIVNRRNRKINVTQGKIFSPDMDGRVTVRLQAEKDGIVNTVEKTVNATAQIVLSPDDKFLLVPGEAGQIYDIDVPVVWNKGSIMSDPSFVYYVYDAAGKRYDAADGTFTPPTAGLYSITYQVNDTVNKTDGTLETTLTVYPVGKRGILADFEDGDVSSVQSDCYYYGEISGFTASTERAHSGTKSAVLRNLSDETREIKFLLSETNLGQDISRSKSFSFWIYIDDPTAAAGKTYSLEKGNYSGWVDQSDPSYVRGSLYKRIACNTWVEVKIERADYESVLGGTIFAGATAGMGNDRWTVADNDYITQFTLTDRARQGVLGEQMSKQVRVFVDDFTLEF